MNRSTNLAIVLASGLLFFAFPQAAHASIETGAADWVARPYYIGPGTLTIIWQVIIALAIGGVAMIGIYRVRVRMFLSNLFAKRGSNRDEGNEGSEDIE